MTTDTAGTTGLGTIPKRDIGTGPYTVEYTDAGCVLVSEHIMSDTSIILPKVSVSMSLFIANVSSSHNLAVTTEFGEPFVGYSLEGCRGIPPRSSVEVICINGTWAHMTPLAPVAQKEWMLTIEKCSVMADCNGVEVMIAPPKTVDIAYPCEVSVRTSQDGVNWCGTGWHPVKSRDDLAKLTEFTLDDGATFDSGPAMAQVAYRGGPWSASVKFTA